MVTVEGQNQPKIKIATNRKGLKEIAENGGEDRISAMPDCLLVEILSRLGSTEDAIRTGILSNRWKLIWTSIPVLIFKKLNYERPLSKFVSFVEKTLTQRRQLKLKKFVLYTDYSNRSQIETWIRYAIRCDVEELNLEVWGVLDEFRLESYFFINSCLTDLRLKGCILETSATISWKNLSSLWIGDVKLDVDLMKNIFSGSPVLETLVLENLYCYGVNRLDITSKSVKKFVLSGFRILELDHSGYGRPVNYRLEINAPYILSLTIKGHLSLWNLLLLNVSSLIEAGLEYRMYWGRMRKEEALKRFILNLSHVKKLKIGPSCSKVLSHLKVEGFVVPSNIKFSGASESESESESEGESESESESESEE